MRQQAQVNQAGTFRADYREKGFHQLTYNLAFFQQIIPMIQTRFAGLQRQLRVLDIGAGDGYATQQFARMLDSAGIDYVIEGWDPSAAQIARAKELETDNLQFKQKAVMDLNMKGQVDVVLSLFAYHWFNQQAAAADKINHALTDGGLFFALVPLQNPQMLALRQENIQAPKRRAFLQDLTLRTIEASAAAYANVFQQAFAYPETIRQDNNHEFTPIALATFLQSWMPECRASDSRTRNGKPIPVLTDKQTMELTYDLIDRFPVFSQDSDVGLPTNGDEGVVLFQQRVAMTIASNQPHTFEFQALFTCVPAYGFDNVEPDDDESSLIPESSNCSPW